MSSDAGYPFKVWHLDARSECVTVCQFTVTILKRKLFPYWILLNLLSYSVPIPQLHCVQAHFELLSSIKSVKLLLRLNQIRYPIHFVILRTIQKRRIRTPAFDMVTYQSSTAQYRWLRFRQTED